MPSKRENDMSKCRFHIAIIETSQILYEGIHAMLSASDAECSVVRCDSLDNLSELLHSKPLDIVIVDPLHIQNRLKEIKKIRKQFPKPVFIAISISLIDKDIQVVYDTLYSIYDSPEQIVSGLCRLVDHNHAVEDDENDETLSEREIEVLTLLLKGFSNKEIADSLNISVHTVVTHRKNITLKTGIRSQSGLTIYAISKKIVSMEDF